VNEGSRKAIVAAFAANLGLAVLKLVAWTFTGAASMLAEGVHSLADTANQALLLVGGARAQRAATPQHPFGYGRERYFWSFVVAIVLFLLGGLFAIYQGVTKLQQPHPIESPAWAIGVLLGGIVLEGASFRTAVREANRLRDGASWWQFIRRAKSPELPVVLLEDAGALLGLVFALAAVCASVLTGNGAWDAAGSIAIGALLTVISLVLATEMKSLLIGESGSVRDVAHVRAALAGHPQITRILHMRTQHIGPDDLLVAAKVELNAELDFRAVAAALNEAEAAVRAAVPAVGIVYLEPDVYDPGRDPSPG
jgi:cation diffusion facilitator family transporter